MFCPQCGYQNPDNCLQCQNCQAQLNPTPNCQQGYQQNNISQAPQPVYAVANPEDCEDKGLNALSFFIPLVGWIMYFLDRKEYPKKAHGEGKWGLIGFAVWFFLNLILTFIVVLVVFNGIFDFVATIEG